MADGGYSRKSMWGDHTNHYDAAGNKIGESRDSIWGDHVNQYDAAGNKIGESRGSMWGDHTNHYDAAGNKIGESRDSMWGDHVNHYDASGSKIGESRESLWGDHVNHSGSWHSDTVKESSPGATGLSGVSGIDSGLSPASTFRYAPGGGGSRGITDDLLVPSRTRIGLFGQHMVMLIGGGVICTIAIFILAVLTSILDSFQWAVNLASALTFQNDFGLLLALSWIVACLLLILVGQFLFTRNGDCFLGWAFGGLVIGSSVLLVLGVLGGADGWGGALPATGMFIGYVAGSVRDRRAS